MKKLFSLPINPKLNENTVNDEFIPWLEQHKEYIFDLYFTCRMPPFLQDAMGDTFQNDIRETTINALYIADKVGIPLSATFNNLYVLPTQKNLDIWIENFYPLYDRGIRIVTLPHTTWMLTGQIQRAFPELYVKNTILREVTKANEVVELAKAGFNYVNLDRDLMRDHDQLKRLKEAKEYCASIGKPVKFSMLSNEGCWGGCPIMPEHYQYNSNRTPNDPQYFNDSISRVSCSKWDIERPSAALKAANLPPWKEDWAEMLELGIDVFKMHGRENAVRLRESMDIIERWANDETLLFPEFNDYIEDTSMAERPIDIWRDKIKTCKFDCWDCHYCEDVTNARIRKEERKLDPLVSRVLDSVDKAGKFESGFDAQHYYIGGLSSNRVRHFLNNLLSTAPSIYLELGCYIGSTFYAATQNNSVVSYAVDNYSQVDIKPIREDHNLPNPKDPKLEFLSNFYNPKWRYIDKDIKDLNGDEINLKPNVIFYDASHEYYDQLENLNAILPLLADKFILVLDDANFEGVVKSADDFVTNNKLKNIFSKLILTSTVEDEKDWWNGIYILVLEK